MASLKEVVRATTEQGAGAATAIGDYLLDAFDMDNENQETEQMVMDELNEIINWAHWLRTEISKIHR